jgi:HNH endonuclease
MLNKPAKSGRAMATDRIPEFWVLLEYFWDKDRIDKWRSVIFPDPQNPHTGVESCFNLISLRPDAHDFWGRGLFALKPLELSNDRRKLDLQFFWQPQAKSKVDERVNLLTEPSSSRGLNSVDECGLHDMNRHMLIRSGDTFTLTTDDPESRPLPSIELLDMQWVLQRIVAMSGAAEWSWIGVDDDSDYYFNYNYMGRTYSHIPDDADKYTNICEWIPDPIPLVSAKA